jgi:hypothetical protein
VHENILGLQIQKGSLGDAGVGAADLEDERGLPPSEGGKEVQISDVYFVDEGKVFILQSRDRIEGTLLGKRGLVGSKQDEERFLTNLKKASFPLIVYSVLSLTNSYTWAEMSSVFVRPALEKRRGRLQYRIIRSRVERRNPVPYYSPSGLRLSFYAQAPAEYRSRSRYKKE